MKRLTYAPKDFAWTQWSVADIKKLAPQILAEKKARLAKIKKISPAARTFENTVYALEASDYGLSETILKIDLLQNVSPEKAIRDEAKRTTDTIEKKMIGIVHDPKIWEALKDYERKSWKEEHTHLDEPSKKLFHEMLLEYRRMGFDLPPQKQKRLHSLEQELAKASSEFRHNINAYKDHILVSEKEIDGLSERYKQGLKRDKKGNYIVTLAYPDYHPFMELAHSEAKREELNKKFLQRGGLKNMTVLKKMLSLRAERAAILGYKNHADYRTELRMAKKGIVASTFISDLIKKVKKGSQKDMTELLALKRKLTGDKTAKLYTYDIAHYGHKLQKHRFNFDSEEVREYFPLARVLDGTFKIYGALFGVTFEKQAGYPLWHSDADLYAVKNSRSEIISYFALDLHPREGKYGHAAAFGIIGGHNASLSAETYVAPFATMVANFTKPTTDNPSLLSHGEVETFLHEFGHIMHCVLTTATYASQSGYHTAWDFVEAPSQMLEHWAWDKKALGLLSSHYKTEKIIPNALLKNLIASKNHLIRYNTLRQLIFAIFDLTLHTEKRIPEPNTLYRSLVKKYTGMYMPAQTIFPAGFGHLDGYDAGYYGYMWSNVYAADMFTRFEKEGVLNKKTGADYKKWILEKGGSHDEIELVKAFLGRTPSNKAFLKEIGVDK